MTRENADKSIARWRRTAQVTAILYTLWAGAQMSRAASLWKFAFVVVFVAILWVAVDLLKSAPTRRMQQAFGSVTFGVIGILTLPFLLPVAILALLVSSRIWAAMETLWAYTGGVESKLAARKL